ncbi:MAG: hypothetical protein P8J18_04885 [Halieaceae bacterium]|nr:hypothetical protein [Halieaceae bacterium]
MIEPVKIFLEAASIVKFLLGSSFLGLFLLIGPVLSETDSIIFPASICKAKDPVKNSSLQWRENGLINTDSDTQVTVICPFPWTSSGERSSFYNVGFKATLQVDNESSFSRSVACAMSAAISKEQVAFGQEDIELALSPQSSKTHQWTIQAMPLPGLTTYNVKCELPPGVRLTFSSSETVSSWNWAPGGSYDTYLKGFSGRIAVRVTLPEEARFSNGAPVLVHTNTFFTPESGFDSWEELKNQGIIHISLLYPGDQDKDGRSSEGLKDYGGSESLAALRDVIRYAGGEMTDIYGQSLSAASSIKAHENNLGIYAFSHPGILATRVLAVYGKAMPVVNWFVGRENPTSSALSSVEVGHWVPGAKALQNPTYTYPDQYDPQQLRIDYSDVKWAEDWTENGQTPGRPYFDLDDNGEVSDDDYVLGSRVPSMYSKRVYSKALLNSELTTASEAEILWEERITTNIYELVIANSPDVHVMLVFAEKDHVQPAFDKPHIHQARDGFYDGGRGVWVRLNPDSAYVESVSGVPSSENPAGVEPTDWLDVEAWGYPNSGRNSDLYPLAAVLEMVDRQFANNWTTNDLTDVVVP